MRPQAARPEATDPFAANREDSIESGEPAQERPNGATERRPSSPQSAALDGEARQRFAARALQLASAAESPGAYSGGTAARIAIVPIVSTEVLDDVALTNPEAADPFIAIGRDTGVLPQSLGVEVTVSSTGIQLNAGAAGTAGMSRIRIHRDGSVLVEADVSAPGLLGSMQIDPRQLSELSSRAGDFAARAWQLRGESSIERVCATLAIPGAQNRVFGVSDGSTLSMGGAMTLPSTVVAPDPPVFAAINELGTPELAERLLAAVELVFRDARATIDP